MPEDPRFNVARRGKTDPLRTRPGGSRPTGPLFLNVMLHDSLGPSKTRTEAQGRPLVQFSRCRIRNMDAKLEPNFRKGNIDFRRSSAVPGDDRFWPLNFTTSSYAAHDDVCAHSVCRPDYSDCGPAQDRQKHRCRAVTWSSAEQSGITDVFKMKASGSPAKARACGRLASAHLHTRWSPRHISSTLQNRVGRL